MKDRHLLQEVFRTSYRMQERNDVLAKRRDAAKKTRSEGDKNRVELEEAEAKRRGSLEAAALDVIGHMSIAQAVDAVMQRTGAKLIEAERAMVAAYAKKYGDFRANPKFRFAERVADRVKRGGSKEEAEDLVSRVIVTKEIETREKPATANAELPLEKLAVGQHFTTDTAEAAAGRKAGYAVETRTGYVVAKSPGSVTVRLSGASKKTSSFVAKGRSVEFSTSGSSEQRLAPDMIVKALEKIEDLALLVDNHAVQSSGSPIKQDSEEESMAKGKKAAAKKAPAAKKSAESKGAGRGPAFGSDAVVKRLKGPSEEQIKRHVTILTCLKEGGDKMTVAQLAKALGKASNTKQDPEKVLRMHVKALTDGGFISVTPASA